MPCLASWRMAAKKLLTELGVPRPRLPSLAALRGRWRYLVADVSDRSRPLDDPDAVYVGRSWRLGCGTAFGNHAPRGKTDPKLRGARRVVDHERAVREYARWLAEPAQAGLRRRISRGLRGRTLVCHCSGKGLPCHAEVVAAVANECVPCSTLSSYF